MAVPLEGTIRAREVYVGLHLRTIFVTRERTR
jgi:hypothetical protein